MLQDKFSMHQPFHPVPNKTCFCHTIKLSYYKEYKSYLSIPCSMLLGIWLPYIIFTVYHIVAKYHIVLVAEFHIVTKLFDVFARLSLLLIIILLINYYMHITYII